MIIYNVTTHIEKESEQEFVQWMQSIHIKEVLDTQLFIKAIFSKIIEGENPTGSSYSTQYYCENRALLEKYYTEKAPELRKKAADKFGQKMLAFRTELEVLNEF